MCDQSTNDNDERTQRGTHVRSWFDQHRRLAKLNLQAHQSAMARSDEYILEALLTFDKLGVVVHELLAIEAWKEVGASHDMAFDRRHYAGKLFCRVFVATRVRYSTLLSLTQDAAVSDTCLHSVSTKI